MSRELFADFLHDATQYEQAEGFWQNLFDEVVLSQHVEQEWERPWLVTHFVDGTPFSDGNPIFTAWAPLRRLGIRVIQNEVGSHSDVSAFDSWFDEFASENGPIRELVISCTLSAEAVERANALMRDWVSRQAKTG